MVVIEMNPRVSRSSALASKATGFPDRQDRGQALRRLHPGRDSQRHHPGDLRLLRADHRLRGDQDSALHLRKIPPGRRHPDHPDEIGRGGDGDRPDLQGEPAEGPALPGDRFLRLGKPDFRLAGRLPAGAFSQTELDTPAVQAADPQLGAALVSGRCSARRIHP